MGQLLNSIIDCVGTMEIQTTKTIIVYYFNTLYKNNYISHQFSQIFLRKYVHFIVIYLEQNIKLITQAHKMLY